jgi:hypothetical protein
VEYQTGDLISERWPQINMNLTPAKAYSPDGSMRAQSSTEYIGVDLNISVAIVDNHTNLYVCTF